MSTLNRIGIPEQFDPGDVNQLDAAFAPFAAADLATPEAARQWLDDLGALFEVIYEEGSRRSIANACHTEDQALEDAYMHWVREVQPKLQPISFRLQQKLLASPAAKELTTIAEQVMLREWRADVEIYREKNIPLQTQSAELIKDYGKITGAMTVEFDGQTLTLQQMARYLDDTNRDVREQAWALTANRRLDDRAKFDELFGKLLDLRTQMAANADKADYREYIWQSRGRFDYTHDDCLAFGDAVEAVCLPLVKRLDAERQSTLSVDRLRPWDISVDPLGRSPLRPFKADDIDNFVARTREVFARISPDLATRFDALKEHGNLDLDSRRGKRPGGFQAALEKSKQPFIFMNAAGLQRDVETLVHEGGHAFHYQAAAPLNLFVRHAKLEFCEVASMSMELLACDHLDVYYADASDAARAKRFQLEGTVRLLPWIATIDGFQHWLYTHPGHSDAERTQAWLDISGRFANPAIDYTGHEAAKEAAWHRQLHLFHAPFYYIEYGIAQLGALQVWMNYREDPPKALQQLQDAFALGGSRPLPELFETAGIRFDFSPDTVEPLAKMVDAELATLPK